MKPRPGLVWLWLPCLLLASAAAPAATHRVTAPASIAAALEQARPGDVIEVEPGVYHEALTVDTPGITLRGIVRGVERPLLDGRGRLNDGVIVSGSPFAMSGFALRHYKGNGVTTQGVDGVAISDLVIDDTGRYGVYPVQSRNISVTHCTITGINDAAIYVGESNQALVAYNEVHDNVAGIEIENTNDTEVRDNLVYDNSAGILVFVLPSKQQKHGVRNHVHRNWVVRNDHVNFGDPQSIVGALPNGIGIMVMGADETRVHDNWVKHNGSVGILVIRLGPEYAQRDLELEPLADGTRIDFNYVAGNGRRPHPKIARSLGGGDLGWDGTGQRNCADLPDAATVVGTRLPACGPAPAPSAAAPHAEHAGEPAPAPVAAVLPAGAAVVRIRGMRFEPHDLTVRRGVPVVWVNDDAVTHTVTSGIGTQPTASPLASPFLRRGDVYRFDFASPGRYEYLCLPHLDQAPMRGATVTVQD
jgi:parallel beta-helix repeat protein